MAPIADDEESARRLSRYPLGRFGDPSDVAGAALYVEITYEPPYWVHAVLWGPLALLVPFALLRPLKALLLYMQYRHRAAEVRFKHD